MSAIRSGLRSGDFSSAELVQAHIDRIETVNPTLNAVVVRAFERALDEAKEADEDRARGRYHSDLHGVPVTIKDCFDTAGLTTTGGTLGRENHVPGSDATAVARLRQGGAIVLGKTNCPEFSFSYETDNLVYGRTNNPYSNAHVPGGSSGGEGAIISACGSPLGLASDGAGSTRVPAAFNGIAGLKTTTGRVPMTGYWPPMPSVLTPCNSVGLMARHVDDLALALEVVSGIDNSDCYAQPVPVATPNTVDLVGLRIAVFTDNGIVPADDVTAATVDRVARALADAGCRVAAACPPGVDQTLDLFMRLFAVDGGMSIRRHLDEAGTEQPHPTLRALLSMPAPAMSGAEVAGVLEGWEHFRRAMLEFMAGHDAILCPVCANSAFRHRETFENMAAFSYVISYNLAGWPALTLRAGANELGLPVGVQFAAAPWREDIVLALGAFIEQECGGWVSPQRT